MPRKRNDERFRQIKEMWDAGATVNELADKFDCRLTTMKATLNKMGISFARDMTKEHEIMRQMRTIGKSLAQISEATGISQNSISAYLTKMGMSHSKKIDHGTCKSEVKECENLTYAPPKQIKKLVANDTRYEDVTEFMYQQYEG